MKPHHLAQTDVIATQVIQGENLPNELWSK